MSKHRYSLSLEADTMELIDKVAVQNNMSRSATVRMILDLAKYVPIEQLRISPISALLVKEMDKNASC